jgi:VRR-NUC domain
LTILPPLLALAAGRIPRPRRAPVIRPKEIELHMTTAKILRQHCLENWRWFHPGSGELRDPVVGAKLKRMGMQRGVPDFVLIPPSGRVCFLELKRIGERLSEEQEDFRLWCITHAVPYCVAHDIDQVLTALDAWGCLRIVIPKRGIGSS